MENNNEATKKVFSKEQLQRMSDDALKAINDDQTIEIKKTILVEEIKEEEPVTEEPALDENETESKPTEEVADNSETNDDDLKPLDKKGKKKFIIIIIAVVLAFLLLIGGFIALIIYKKQHKKAPKKADVIVKKDNYRYENGKLIFVDNNKEIGKYQCKNKSVDECYLASYANNEDQFLVPQMIYESGDEVVDGSDFINNQYAFIVDGKKAQIIIYDFVNNKEIDKVDKVKYYGKENNVILVKNNKYGLANFGKDSIDFTIDYNYEYMGVILGSEQGNDVVVKNGDNYRLVDYNNKALSKNITGPIRLYNDKYIIAGEDGKLYLYDYNNKLVFNKSYSFIKLLNDYVIVVKDLDLNVLDYEGNVYNVEPITLKNSNYVPKNIYDKKGKKVKTDESFEEQIKDNKLIITIKGDSDTKVSINLLEGKVNKNIKYVNYFDGTLYFYSDEEKTQLIGTYTCTNKNTITEDTTTLNNCFVAKDTVYENNDMENNDDKTVGIIPIIGQRFVFIDDTKPTDSKRSIKLYSLDQKKTLGGYQSVCTYLFSGLEDVSFASLEYLDIIARNPSGKMGLIKLEQGEIKSGIKFNYLTLEKMGKYYLGKTENAKYVLIYDNTGVNTSIEFNGMVKGYTDKYIKVMEGNKYAIYDFDGNKINTSNYKYIELLDGYYGAVNDSNNLVIYNYQNEQRISDEIKLYSNKYTDAEKPSFKLEIQGVTKIQISVLKDGEYTDHYYDLTTGLKVEG